MPRSGSRVRVPFSARHDEQKSDEGLFNWLCRKNAQVAELVDAHVSGACAARRAGSSPVLGTLFYSAYVGEVAELVDALL